MVNYRVRVIDLNGVKDSRDYSEALKNSKVHYCHGLKEVEAFCGGKLRRERCGYSGIIDNIQYVAEKY